MYIKRIKGTAGADKKIFLDARIAVALGNFDGLHKGHESLIKTITDYAQKHSAKSCVFSFDTNVSGAPYITSGVQRERLLSNQKVDFFVMQEFNNNFKNHSPHDFFERYIRGFLSACYVVAGYNYRFGYNAAGDADLLKKLCLQHNINVKIMPPVLYRGEPISSTRIRKSIESGRLGAAKDMLGREFSVSGKVMEGDKLGSRLGFPTANINIDTKHVMPPNGVYATVTYVKGKCFSSVTNLGGKPTIKKGGELIETHILEFSGNLYGEEIEVGFLKRIRSIKAFATKAELCKQLADDKKMRKKIGREGQI